MHEHGAAERRPGGGEAASALAGLAARLRTEEPGPDALDGLPAGAILVDETGAVRAYNATEAAMSGRSPDRVLGRDFFRDVAPCANVPAFAGRFREGARLGFLDASFDFAFDFRMRPVRVRVHMSNAARAGHYWILTKVVERTVPHRAPHAGAGAPAAEGAACATEAIRTPGAIQPFGVLLVADARTLAVVAASANAASALGMGARDALGHGLADLLGAEFARGLRRRLALDDLPGPRPWHGSVALGPGGARHETTVHLHGGLVHVELEPAAPPERDPDGLSREIHDALARMRGLGGVDGLTQVAARSIREITGFERVLVYRFDQDWHGEVVAEDKATDWDQSLVGLHFPACEVPRQARELYAESPLRMVPERDYEPVPVLLARRAGPGPGRGAERGPARGSDREWGDEPGAAPDERPLDLSFVRLRSVSPVHLQYHRAMGVDGSMSLSVLCGGRLWGLVVGHSRAAHRVPVARRLAAEDIVAALSGRIEAAEREAAARRGRADAATHRALLARMAMAKDVAEAAVGGSPSIGDLFGACGAAVVRDGEVRTVGAAPPPGLVRALASWLREGNGAGGGAGAGDGAAHVATDRLPALFPDAWPHREVASGLLAVFLDEGRRDALLWFRPEEPRVLVWGGAPTGDGAAPRRSFERRVEERLGHSAPWSDGEVEIALGLRQAIKDVILRHLRKLAAMGDELRRANAAKSIFLANMSHELRTPLNAVIGFSDLIRRGIHGPLPATYAEYAGDIHASGEHLLALVDDILDLSRIEARQRALDEGPVDLPTILAQALRVEAPLLAAAGLEVARHVPDPPPRLVADGRALLQMLLNLLSNARKFTPAGGRVELRAEDGPDGVRVTVADTGIGIPREHLARVLEPFVQVEGHLARTRQGTGLGLSIVRSLMELHGGRVELDSEPGAGTRVALRFPASRSGGPT